MFGDIIFEHTVKLATIILALLGAGVVGLFTFWRYVPVRRTAISLGLLRLAFLLVFLWCLLMPVLKQSLTEQIRPRFVVAIDNTESMALSPSPEMSNRWTVVKAVMAMPWTKTLREQCDIDCYSLSGDIGNRMNVSEISTLNPDGKVSNLRACLQKLADRYKGQNVAGILALTDGLDTREINDQWATADWTYPIYTVRTEPPDIWKVEPDVRVDSVDTARRVVVGWDTDLKTTVSGQGSGGKSVEVQLYENDRLLEEKPIEIPDDGGSREVTFRLNHPETGAFVYTVKLPQIKGERRTNDNSYAINVQVTDAKNRLLYLESVPRWESKYLIQTLKGIKEVNPVCFVKGPGGKFLVLGSKTSSMPALTESQLLNFKIVILGDLSADELGKERAENIAKYVENGGSLVLLGGSKTWGARGFQTTALARVLPIKDDPLALDESDYQTDLTPEGRAHPAFLADDEKSPWRKVPQVNSLFPGATLKPGAQALTITQRGGHPVIAVQKYGQGKVVAILTDTMWRWKLNPGKEEPYRRFWNRLAVWLCPTEGDMKASQLDLFADAERLFLGDPIELKARMGGQDTAAIKDLKVSCEITGPDNRTLPFKMDRQDVITTSGKKYPGYSLPFNPPAPGMYKAVAKTLLNGEKVESAPYSFVIKPFTPESNPRPINVAVLSALANSSKGQFCEPEQINDILSAIKIQTTEQSRVTYKSLWNHPIVISCLILLISLEWMLRKFKNMP